MLLPAAGFDVVASDCLAAHVIRRCPRAMSLHLGLSGLALMSRGSALTLIDQLGEPVWVRRDGVLRRVPPGALERSFDFGAGPSPSIAVSWGDVATACFSTGVRDTTAYFDATTAVRAHHLMLKLAGNGAFPLGPWRTLLRRFAEWMPEGPSAERRAEHGATVVAEMLDERGRSVCARLRTPEVYSFTAVAAIAIARRALCGDVEPGFQTPARVYGPDFVVSLPGVSREDL
jgi:short subunit dehydrogenase-like uncharacterized protein